MGETLSGLFFGSWRWHGLSSSGVLCKVGLEQVHVASPMPIRLLRSRFCPYYLPPTLLQPPSQSRCCWPNPACCLLPVLVNRVYRTVTNVLSTAAFLLHWSWVVVTKRIWLTKSNIVTTWSFTEKDCGVLIKQNVSLLEAYLSIPVSKIWSCFHHRIGQTSVSRDRRVQSIFDKSQDSQSKGAHPGLGNGWLEISMEFPSPDPWL